VIDDVEDEGKGECDLENVDDDGVEVPLGKFNEGLGVPEGRGACGLGGPASLLDRVCLVPGLK
jgi:hypothetical protein